MPEGSLFGETEPLRFEVPLAERMRPASLDEYAGQSHILGRGRALRLMLEGGKVPSCILYGPPGVGKTTLVRLMAKVTGRELLEINAVSAKVETLRDLLDEAAASKAATGRSAIAFVDEIYHFNKKQQNVLLPSVEAGGLILVGTTTENPWFEINKTLLSRMVVYTLEPLRTEDICALLERALADKERGLGRLGVTADRKLLERIAALAGGDECAKLAVDKMCDYLALAMSQISCIVDPEMYLIGGGVAGAFATFAPELREKFAEYALKPCKEARIEAASLGNQAAMYGCAYEALRLRRENRG